ncbi:Patellin-5 [Acorus calamus]|uniref:Patellin-5 n=1 Tax=Acorus calamus TaxID=4465 RepID=A0AAV9EYB3_ACOCL|nr:Patellin-5 [Acorus calamus]
MDLRDPHELSDEREQKKLALMRAFVEREDPASKEVDDLELRRFLRAREQDIEKASKQFLKSLKWRRTAVPNGFISESEIPNELEQDKVFMQGFDKKGSPISVVLGAKHFQTNTSPDQFKRMVAYALDKFCASMPRGQEKFTVIGDLQNWGYANCDIRAFIAALDIMQSYYPERLGKVFIIHVPYIFWAAWKIIYPFIDQKTKKKFVFVEDKKLKETLLQDIEESQLPDIYGGKLQLVPIQGSSS